MKSRDEQREELLIRALLLGLEWNSLPPIDTWFYLGLFTGMSGWFVGLTSGVVIGVIIGSILAILFAAYINRMHRSYGVRRPDLAARVGLFSGLWYCFGYFPSFFVNYATAQFGSDFFNPQNLALAAVFSISVLLLKRIFIDPQLAGRRAASNQDATPGVAP